MTLRVFDDDMMTKDDPLGEVVIPFWQVDFSTGVEEFRNLQPITKASKKSTSRARSMSASSDEEKKKASANIGRIKYSIQFDSPSNKVILNVLQAKVGSYFTNYWNVNFGLLQNLKKQDLMGQSDPYVLVSIPGSSVKQVKTKQIKNNANPVWNETFSFDVSFLMEI